VVSKETEGFSKRSSKVPVELEWVTPDENGIPACSIRCIFREGFGAAMLPLFISGTFRCLCLKDLFGEFGRRREGLAIPPNSSVLLKNSWLSLILLEQEKLARLDNSGLNK